MPGIAHRSQSSKINLVQPHFYWAAACIAKETVMLRSQRVFNIAIALRNQVIVNDPRYQRSGLLKLSQIGYSKLN